MKEFVCEIPVRWGDLDAMGHLNNATYFRLMEEARVQWFAQLGFGIDAQQGEAPILAHAACDFVKAIEYPATAVVRQTVTRIGRSSIEMSVVLECKDAPGVACATGRTVVVWYDYASAQSRPWPQAVRALIE